MTTRKTHDPVRATADDAMAIVESGMRLFGVASWRPPDHADRGRLLDGVLVSATNARLGPVELSLERKLFWSAAIRIRPQRSPSSPRHRLQKLPTPRRSAPTKPAPADLYRVDGVAVSDRQHPCAEAIELKDSRGRVTGTVVSTGEVYLSGCTR